MNLQQDLVRSYLVGRFLAWGRLQGGLYAIAKTSLNKHCYIENELCYKSYNLNKVADIYIGKISIERLDIEEVQYGMVIGALDYYINTNSAIYPFLNNNKPNLLHLIKKNSNIIGIIKHILKNSVKVFDLGGKKLVTIHIKPEVIKNHYSDKCYTYLKEKSIEKRNKLLGRNYECITIKKL